MTSLYRDFLIQLKDLNKTTFLFKSASQIRFKVSFALCPGDQKRRFQTFEKQKTTRSYCSLHKCDYNMPR